MVSLSDIKKIDNITFHTYSSYKWVKDNILDYPDYPGHEHMVDLSYPETKHTYYQDYTELTLQNSIDNTPIDSMFIMPGYMQYGDYDNSCMVERSNYKLFLEQFGDESGIFTISGAYGSAGIAISLKWLLDPENEDKAQEIIECLNALSDYPCIDDEDMSNMEYDAFLDALDDYGVRDFISACSEKFNLDISDYDLEKTKNLIRELDSTLDYPCYTIECGGSCYIDTDRLVDAVTLEHLKPALTKYEVL